jgi:hypothetical protein
MGVVVDDDALMMLMLMMGDADVDANRFSHLFSHHNYCTV